MSEADFMTEMYTTYYEELTGWARRHTGDWALAEDLVQETMATALQNIEKVRNCPSLEGWLFKTLKFITQRELDKAYREREVGWGDETISEFLGYKAAPGQQLTLEGLEEILPECFPEKLREILRLRYVERMSHKEAAITLGITAAAAQQRVSRAHKWLKEYFESHGMPDGIK